MGIKKLTIEFKEGVFQLLFIVFGNKKFPKDYADLYIDSILNSLYMFPTFVVLDT